MYAYMYVHVCECMCVCVCAWTCVGMRVNRAREGEIKKEKVNQRHACWNRNND